MVSEDNKEQVGGNNESDVEGLNNSEKKRLQKEVLDEVSNFKSDFVNSISELYKEKDHMKKVSHKFVFYYAVFITISMSLYITNSIFSLTSKFIHTNYINVLDFSILSVIELIGGYAIYYAYKRTFVFNSISNSKLEFYSEDVKKIRESTVTKFDGLVAKIRDYVPGMDNIYKEEEKDRLIQEFSTTLFNSLKRYKFDIPREIGKYLVDFVDPFNYEVNWLDKASEDIADQIGTLPIIVKLSYYDYKGDNKNLRNAWNDIVEDKNLFSVLMRHLIAKGLLESDRSLVDEKEIKSLQQAIKNDQLTDITLESFRKYYQEIFKDLRKLKSDIVKLVEEYRFPNKQYLIEKVINFMPKSIIVDTWKEETLGSLASILKISSNMLKLLLAEFNDLFGDRESWYSIRNDPNSLSNLIELLIGNDLLEVPEKFKRDSVQFQKLIKILTPSLRKVTSFGLIEIGERVTSSLTELSHKKKLFISSLKGRGIQIENFPFEEYDSWIPPSFETKEISAYLEDQLGIKQLYSQLFYYSYLNDTKNSNLALTDIIEQSLLKDFSSFLIERKVVPPLREVAKNLQVESIFFILSRKQEFVQDELIKIHYWLNEVYKNYIVMLQFISLEFDKSQIGETFSTVSELFLDDIDKSIEEVQEKLMQYCMIKNFPKSPIQIEDYDIEKAANALFQVSTNGRAKQWACNRAWESDPATNLLFLYVKSFDEYESGILNKSKRLIQIIEEYDVSLIKDEDKRYRFASELKEGKIPIGLSKVYSEDFASIDESIKESGLLSELDATLNDLEQSTFFRDFLNIELPQQLFVDSLNMQLISAYMITSKGKNNEKVISQVVDTYLSDALELVRKKRGMKSHNKLLLWPLDDSLRTIMGRSVRVGLVPFRMQFEDFADLFRDAYEIAVENYLAKNFEGDADYGAYSANLIRIFPSNRFFKQLGRGTISLEEIHEDDPIYAIRNIMSENFSRSQMLEIVATLRNRGEDKLAIHKMMVTLLDNNVSIYQIIKKKLIEKNLFQRVRNSRLNNLLNNKTIDEKLQEIFNRNGLSTLSIYVYKKLTEMTDNSRKTFERDFVEAFKNIIREEQLSDTETTREVSIVILHRLVELGKLLIGIRGEKVPPNN